MSKEWMSSSKEEPGAKTGTMTLTRTCEGGAGRGVIDPGAAINDTVDIESVELRYTARQ